MTFIEKLLLTVTASSVLTSLIGAVMSLAPFHSKCYVLGMTLVKVGLVLFVLCIVVYVVSYLLNEVWGL